ncbi:hypothetical protein KY311_01070 [Candidatus Woesearchaeota archaeon]|nr:hypothetical protein [Candidatus Woesearchaeota archaeon]
MKFVEKSKKLLKDYRVLLLIFFLVGSLLAISPMPGRDGVVIRSIAKNSSAFDAGMQFDSKARPTARERILSIDTLPINTEDEFYSYVSTIEANRTVRITTNVKTYQLTSGSGGELGLKVAPAPTNNIRKGLDLVGGIRAVLKPVDDVDAETLEYTSENLRQRLNVYGLDDVTVKTITWPEQYILVEVAGATEQEVRDLLASQGKFEAVIANQTVFVGGPDIKYVAFSGQQARIETCQQVDLGGESGYQCKFTFAITISQEAAENQAAATADVAVDPENSEYLVEDIHFFLDDIEVNSLRIGADLKGRPVTDLAISGSGSGTTMEQAFNDAQQSMKTLQTVLKTGSLPIKLEFAQIKVISAPLGEDFTKNALTVGLLSILTVSLIVYIRYRKLRIAIPVSITMISEIILILGFAALFGGFIKLDLAAIAGIIIAAGTGVDHQIVITDEVLRGESSQIYDWKRKVKQAFFIIMASMLTTTAAVLPLWFTGAGLLKFFAFTTIVGLVIGVLITRRAFAAIIEILLRD